MISSAGSTTILDGENPEKKASANPAQTIHFDSDSKEQLTPEQIRELLNLPPYTHINDYEELHAIGIGGFGAIYGAKEKELNRKLALKILRPRFRLTEERVRAMIREARSTAQIEHPNIVPVHRLGYFEDAGIYFSMKRVSGENLRVILRKLSQNAAGYRRKYTLTRLIDIFLGACRGVSYAHYNGLVHCDLKPENLMVGNFGEVLVMDWGMAHYLPQLDKAGNHILAESHKGFSQLGGTPVFMAPELLGRTSDVPSAASDIYSLGCILYTILTWKSAPFDPEKTVEEVQHEVVRGKLVAPHRIAPKEQELPRELEAICLKAMSRRQEDRYRSVDELIADIQDYRDNRPVKAYSPSWFYIFGKMLSRHPAIPSTLLIALACWFGFAIYNTTQQHLTEKTQRELAIQSFQNGEIRLHNIYRALPQLNAAQSINRARKLETQINTDMMELKNDYSAAIEFLSQMPEYSWEKPTAAMMVQSIFYNLSRLYITRNEDRELQELAGIFNSRWKRIFNAASKNNPEMRRQLLRILRNKGRLLIVSNFPDGKPPQLIDRSGRKIPHLNFHKDGGLGIYEYFLHCGNYRFRSVLRNHSVCRGAVQISSTRNSALSLIEPEKIPEDMVFIPGGLFKYSSQLSRCSSDKVAFSSFLMKKHEVSIGEYLEFWRTLPAEKKQIYGGYYMAKGDTLYTVPMWDDQGKLQIGTLTEKHPVTGISAEAAAAYCRYLSGKLKMNVQLPTQGQWLKAAYGTEAGDEAVQEHAPKTEVAAGVAHPIDVPCGDESVYGVKDMFGNVREFVRLTGFEGRKYGVIGNSYATPAELRGQQELMFSMRGSNETGFRYIITIPDSGKFQQFL